MTTTTPETSYAVIGTARLVDQMEAMYAFNDGHAVLVSYDRVPERPVTSMTNYNTRTRMSWADLEQCVAGTTTATRPQWFYVIEWADRPNGCRCGHQGVEHGPYGCEHTSYGPHVMVLCSCSAAVVRAPLPEPCQQRADTLRTRWESHPHRATPSSDPTVIAWRLAWDAPAAGDYPGPMVEDAAAVAAVYPELAARAWHHAAGATILGTYCCGTPGSHRDALVTMARVIRRERDR